MLAAWYPGGEGGGAVADVLFGDADPAAACRSRSTRRTADLPPFTDYSMRGRTYRYFSGTAAVAVRARSQLHDVPVRRPARRVGGTPGTPPVLSLTVTNTGRRSGDDVLLAFVTHEGAGSSAPRKALAAFRRVTLDAGASTRVSLPLDAEPLTIVDERGTRHPATGTVTVTVGNLSTTFLPTR